MERRRPERGTGPGAAADPLPGRGPATATDPQAPCPAVVVHTAAQAMAALASLPPSGPGVLLLSPPGAAGSMGAAWFLALVEAAAAAHPARPYRAVLDCADAPGHALAALRAGARTLVLDPACPAFARVATAAEEVGAELWTGRPAPALDLARLDLARPAGQARLAAWLGQAAQGMERGVDRRAP